MCPLSKRTFAYAAIDLQIEHSVISVSLSGERADFDAIRRKASIISEQGPQRVASAQTEGSHAQSVSAHTQETAREQEPVRPEAQGYAPREEFLTPESYAHIAQIVREAEEVQPIDTTAQRSKSQAPSPSRLRQVLL